MFAAHTAMTLTSVCFTTEVEDEETRRVVECALKIAPFTIAHADDLNLRTLMFDSSTGTLKPALDQIVASIAVPEQRLTWARSPEAAAQHVILPCVRIEGKLRAKVKLDREPPTCEAVLKISFQYPTADDLLQLAGAVNDVIYVTFEPEQGDLLTAQDDQEPIRRAH